MRRILSTARLGLLLFMACALFGARSSIAQDFPSKPVRLIVTSSAGSVPDTLARILAPEMSKFLGQTVVIEAKPGADNLIGMEYVAKQVPPDGYTILQTIAQTVAIMPVLVKDLRFDPLKDLPPFIGLVEGRNVLASPLQAPWKTFNEMVSMAKANPGKFNYGGPSPFTRLSVDAFLRPLGINAVYVAYSESRFYQQGLLTNEIQLGILTVGIATSPGGEKFRYLAVTGDRRHPALPDVPTFTELGHGEVRGTNYMLNTPARTPKAAVDKLFAAASRALQQPIVRSLYGKFNYDVVELGTEDAVRNLAEVAKYYSDLAKTVGIKPQ